MINMYTWMFVTLFYTTLNLKGTHVTRDYMFMFWNNANDYARVIIYQSNNGTGKWNIDETY